MPLVTQRYSQHVTITAIVIAVGGFVFFPAATDAAGIPPRAIPVHAGLHLESRTARDVPINGTRARVTNIGNPGF